jgi:hypothetical protein
MPFGRNLVATMILAGAGVTLAGCAPTVADGARAVFSTSQICDHAGVTVKERSDLAPHAVLKGVAPPPGVELDSVGSTYEISGCGAKLVFVCGRPVVGQHGDPFSAEVTSSKGSTSTDVAFNTRYFAITRSMGIDGNRVSNAVVCQPGSPTVQ